MELSSLAMLHELDALDADALSAAMLPSPSAVRASVRALRRHLHTCQS
jgi:hypothetical protein